MAHCSFTYLLFNCFRLLDSNSSTLLHNSYYTILMIKRIYVLSHKFLTFFHFIGSEDRVSKSRLQFSTTNSFLEQSKNFVKKQLSGLTVVLYFSFNFFSPVNVHSYILLYIFFNLNIEKIMGLVTSFLRLQITFLVSYNGQQLNAVVGNAVVGN